MSDTTQAQSARQAQQTAANRLATIRTQEVVQETRMSDAWAKETQEGAKLNAEKALAQKHREERQRGRKM